MTVFLFTDIQGSTEMLEQYGDAMTQAMLQHEALLRQVVEQHGGLFVKNTGDGIFAVFESGKPLDCALEMQQRLADQDWGEVQELLVRVVLHAGKAEHRDDDYYGLEVSRTSRLLTAAWGGQILFTPAVLGACAVPTDAVLQDHGLHILKDLSEPQHIYEMLHPSLPTREFPPLRSLSSRPHNLPAQPTPFIGREEEMAEISAQLADPACRLLTLTGPGGTGKTRLALQTAALCLEDYLHGAHFVPLAPLASSDLLVPAIAEALKFSFHTREVPKTQLLNYLHQKNMLLVMDNFEHIIGGAGLVAEILLAAPQVKVLATSRARLNIQGETVLEITGMGYPENAGAEDFDTYSAIQLFTETAQRANAAFTLQEAHRPAILHICRLVEGLPLAIEIAASWTRLLSPAEIAQEIQNSLDFLQTTLRDSPERHRSLRAVFEYSWALLSEPEKQAFRRLSVFHGKFSRQAALQVAQVPLPHLAALADQSLVKFFPPNLYDLHTLLRQYAAERLAEDPQEQQQTLAQHCTYFTAFLQARTQPINSDQQMQVMQEIGENIQDILAAWQWAVEQAQVQTIDQALETLFHFYDIRGWINEAIASFSKALQMVEELERRAPDPAQSLTLARLQIRLGDSLSASAQYDTAFAIIQKGLSTARSLDQPVEIVHALSGLTRIHWIRGEHTLAQQLGEEGLVIARQIEDPYLTALMLNNLGANAWLTGKIPKARQFYEQALELFRQVDNLAQIASCLDHLGVAARDLGDPQTGKQYALECVDLLKTLGAQRHLAYALNHVASCETLLGNYQSGLDYFEQSLQAGLESGDRRIVTYTLADIAEVLTMCERYEEARQKFHQAIAQFQELGDTFGVIYSSFGLGHMLTALGEYQQAAPHLAFALEKSREINNQRALLEALAYSIAWFASQNQTERCLEIIGYVLPNSHDIPFANEEAQKHLERLRQTLPAEVIEAGLARGHADPTERILPLLKNATPE